MISSSVVCVYFLFDTHHTSRITDATMAADSSLQHCGNHIDNKCSQCQRLQETISELQRECEILRQANSTILQRQLDGEAEISRLKEENKSLQILFEEADKRGKYHDIVKKNRHWEYPVDETTLRSLLGFDSEDLVDMADITTKMRRGEVVNHIGPNPRPGYTGYSEGYLPHYKEFAKALIEYRHTIDYMDGEIFRFTLGDVELPEQVLDVLQDALQQTHCHELCFYHIFFSGDEYINFIAKCVQADSRLMSLTLNEVNFERDRDVETLCNVMNSIETLQYLNMSECESEQGGLQDIVFNMLKSKSLVKIDLKNINFGMYDLLPTDMTEFLSSNPSLKNLDMGGNRFNTQDIDYISNALRQNKTLRELNLRSNHGSDDWYYTLESVVFDCESLNGAYDSNHHCLLKISRTAKFNIYDDPVLNRRKKLYNILSTRNRQRENAACFEYDEIGIKHIPQILSMLKLFSEHHVDEEDGWQEVNEVCPLSIAFEIMRDWKMPELYNNLSVMNED